MAKNFNVFQNNRKAIEQRIFGAVVMHYLQMDSSRPVVESAGLQKLFSQSYRTENIVGYYNDTLEKVAKYFNTQATDASFSDFQCVLAPEIYNDYVKA